MPNSRTAKQISRIVLPPWGPDYMTGRMGTLHLPDCEARPEAYASVRLN